jgi:2-polyprenyl-6-methoxyphenol hydroxylase-like FAD-dependent oxidoreductase
MPGVVIDGQFPAHEGVDAVHSPRRALLDLLLVEAAREAGAEIRENFRVTELVTSDGLVTGIRGSARGLPIVTETASLVIGADGKRSLVARAVGARHYRDRPVLSFASYSYWSGVPVSAGELCQRPGRTVAVFPTNDELTMVYVAAPLRAFCRRRSTSRLARSSAFWRSRDPPAPGGDGLACFLSSGRPSRQRRHPKIALQRSIGKGVFAKLSWEA